MSSDHFMRSFGVFLKKSNQHYENARTLQNYLPQIVKKAVSSIIIEQRPQFNILGVGSGTGETDIEIVNIVQRELIKKQEWKHIRILNRAVEPDEPSTQGYKEKIAKVGHATSPNYEIRQQTFQEYQKSNEDRMTFDIVHFIHSLYYVDLEQTVMYCVENLLAENGYLVCLIGNSDSIPCKLLSIMRQRNRDDAMTNLTESISIELSEELVKIVGKHGLKHEFYRAGTFLDVSEVFNEESEEGSLLLDFLTNTENYRKMVSQHDLEETLAIIEGMTFVKDGKRLGDIKESLLFIYKTHQRRPYQTVAKEQRACVLINLGNS
ncbi:histamine N-methyltransferase A-like [Dendronephthya gigantea]|uniref:histamine N-methyltransferase A-like n=1 Tax=Dendronephthya gigantea TaxID=151771 RepID=UPI00106C1064|nr:histamine N-methyltransferase A-like [Dendronephthya gigantea]